MKKTIVKNLETPDKLWTFLDSSKRKVVILESIIIGWGEYLPGWRWSKHVGIQTGKNSESHIGYIFSGKMMLLEVGGQEILVKRGDFLKIGPGHDAWVVGNKKCIAFDFEHLKS
jgi:hypothetical protein